MPQPIGIVFLILLLLYLRQSVLWASREKKSFPLDELEDRQDASLVLILTKLLGAITLVIGSSHILVATAVETADRFHVPEGVIAATLVAFGTSLPELVTAITAVRRKHGDLAIGNVIGADILNVLFVRRSGCLRDFGRS